MEFTINKVLFIVLIYVSAYPNQGKFTKTGSNYRLKSMNDEYFFSKIKFF